MIGDRMSLKDIHESFKEHWKKKVKGHGKNKADDYEGAERIQVPHSTLQHCDPCPACDDGKLYRQLPYFLTPTESGPPVGVQLCPGNCFGEILTGLT